MADDLLALFPLPNVVLFPRVALPLHIFEPRYREMVADVRAAEGRIGMVLLRPDGAPEPGGDPPIFPVGCGGSIGRFELLEDGRSNLVLEGERRFRIVREVPGRAYRRAEVDWLGDGEEERSAFELPADLLAAAEEVLRRDGRTFKGRLADHLPEEPAVLVNSLAAALEFSVVEKMALLECASAAERATRLRDLLQFRLAGSADSGTLQ